MNRQRNEGKASASSDKLEHGVRVICTVLFLHRGSDLLPVSGYRLRVHRGNPPGERHVALARQISGRQMRASCESVLEGQGHDQGIRDESIDLKSFVR